MFGIEKIWKVIRRLRFEHDAAWDFTVRLGTRITALEGQSDYHEAELAKHETAAGGGFWKTAKGHLLRIRDMSTDHIKRCLAGNFAKKGGRARRHMEDELRRRKEEDYWRTQPMPGEEDTDGLHSAGLPDVTDLAYVGTIYGTPIYVPDGTPVSKVKNISHILRRHGL